MARKPRIEYAGAVYHIISRGNYRKDLFTVKGSAESFEKALFEVADRCGWILHAYVIMSNHYHLCLETPTGNLVEGMRWLQGTFGNRFNRYTRSRGHVFQSRYKSLLVEQGDTLASLVNYIHLNPVRAGIVDVEELKRYKHSSFERFFRKQPRSCLQRSAFLRQLGFDNDLAGMRCYHDFLKYNVSVDSEDREEWLEQFTKGMAIGSDRFLKEVADEYRKMKQSENWNGCDLRILNEKTWQCMVDDYLEEYSKTELDLVESKKLVVWKIEIAKKLRQKTAAPNPWIAKRLHMGHPSNISKIMRQTPKSKA